MSTAPIQRNRANLPGGSVAPSRTAAIGGTRVARIAGRRLASRVTRMPASSATTIVRGSNTRPVFGSVNPTTSKSQKRPFARSSPRKSPITEATVPTTSASTKIDVSTCRRDAPSVRSVASSRVRWAIVIDSELAMTKAPTKRAIPPKASRKPWRKVMNSFVSSASAWACSPAGLDLRAGREDLLDLANELLLRRVGLRGHGDLVELAFLLHQPLRGRQVEACERRAADGEAGAELHDPRDRAGAATGPSAWTPIVSPTSKSSFAAVSLSTMTSFGPGHEPSTSVSGLNGESGFAIENPRFGAPPNTTAFPSSPMSCVASESTLPSASATAGSF